MSSSKAPAPHLVEVLAKHLASVGLRFDKMPKCFGTYLHKDNPSTVCAEVCPHRNDCWALLNRKEDHMRPQDLEWLRAVEATHV